eukprot:scaffold51199_cov33-Tisochrysis_lutea.AAC.2
MIQLQYLGGGGRSLCPGLLLQFRAISARPPTPPLFAQPYSPSLHSASCPSSYLIYAYGGL